MPQNNRNAGNIAEREEFLPRAQPIQFTNSTLTTIDRHDNPDSVDECEERQLHALENAFGTFGSWQAAWCFILSLYEGIVSFHMFLHMFLTTDKEYWCAPPDDFTTAEAMIWRNLSRSQKNSCMTPDMGASYPPPTTCTSFEFIESPNGAMTLVEEFGLVCDRKHLLSLVETCFLAGAAAGSITSGWISDRFGRKMVLMIFATIQTILGFALYLPKSLTVYMAMRAVIGFASMTIGMTSFVLVVELVCGRWRAIIGILNILPVPLTYVLTAGIAYYIQDWRLLQVVITIPGLFMLLIWYCVPESPRWLLAHGRLGPLYKLVERAAHMNRRELPPNYKKTLEAVAPVQPSIAKQSASGGGGSGGVVIIPAAEIAVENGGGGDSGGINHRIQSTDSPLRVVFSKQYLPTTCLTFVTWLVLIIVYFGLTLHLSNLGGNIYKNTAIVGSIEALSIIATVYLVHKFGIRRNIIVFMITPGLCCLATNLVPHSGVEGAHSPGVIALAMLAKILIGIDNAIIPAFTAMQYPTVIRNIGVGIGNLGAGIGLILVPYIWTMEEVEQLLPMSILGVCGIIGTVAVLFMKDVHE